MSSLQRIPNSYVADKHYFVIVDNQSFLRLDTTMIYRQLAFKLTFMQLAHNQEWRQGRARGGYNPHRNMLAPLLEGENYFSDIFGSESTPKTVF